MRLIRNSVGEAARFVGFAEKDVHDIVLAIDEACQNIIRHAYKGGAGDISIEIRQRGEDMIIMLRDFADRIDVSKVNPRDLDEIRPGGLGTHLIREVMDEV